jgi:UDP-N-acetylmuramate dehydrogenase
MTVAALSRALPSLFTGIDAELHPDYPLAPWISVRVGGPAELFVRPRSPDALSQVVRRCVEEQLPLSILGGGANTLVGDGGVPGVTVKLPASLFPEQVERVEGGVRVTLGAGAAIARLIVLMKKHAQVGAEFLAGIPGTLGGAATMNAGTKNGECMSVVEAVELATQDGLGWIPRSEIEVRYRHTGYPKFGIISRVRFQLRNGDLARSKAAMDADLGYRKSTQPLSQPNFGSVFTNPPGDAAGRLIESVGLKGHTLGQAQISPLHANWIVNLGGARAKDVTGLMALMQARVFEATGVELHPEVKRLGVFE